MRTEQKVINLFEDKNIFSIKYVFSINAEDDLNCFWDFITNNSNATYELTHAFITQFYNFALTYMLKEDNDFFEIILEESDDYFFFTLWNKKIALLFKQHLQRTSLEYLYNDNKICIKIVKIKAQKKIEKINSKNESREKILINSTKKLKVIPAYTFLNEDDFEELFKLNDDLQALTLNINKVGLNEEVFIQLRSIFSMFCLTLRYYDKIAPIAKTITDFSNLINMNKEKFISLKGSELELINGFVNNIDYWLQTVFVKGGANIYFMDNSIRADYDMIEYMLNPVEIGENDPNLNDIFDF